MINNISFIVIAKNEDFAIKKCLESICNFSLSNCEVICVDSGSTDNTLGIMLSYKDKISNLSVLKLEGELNASVARNAGLKYVSKKYVFYVDGDVELNSGFIHEAIKRITDGQADGCTGILHEVIYSADYKTTVKEKFIRKNCNTEQVVKAAGGIFIVKHSAIKKIEPWDENYFRAQDFEYTLRFSKKHKLVSIPYSMGVHHTKLYTEREFSFFKNGHSMYMGNIIFNNLNKFSNIRELLRRNRGPMTGLLCYTLVILISISQLDLKYYLFPLSLFTFDIIIGLIKNKNIKNYIIENYITSIFIFFGFFYIKKRKLKYNVTEIK
tara:strand:+ start:1893 stop:2864 length:972 start_codon:yes stop_codon:yes gene_type:complete